MSSFLIKSIRHSSEGQAHRFSGGGFITAGELPAKRKKAPAAEEALREKMESGKRRGRMGQGEEIAGGDV
jgi:hypothetical protein